MWNRIAVRGVGTSERHDEEDHMTPHPANRMLVSTILVMSAVLAAACTVDDGWRTEAAPRPLPGVDEISALRSMDGCDDLVDSARPVLERSVEWAWGTAPTTTFGGDVADGVTSDVEMSGGDALRAAQEGVASAAGDAALDADSSAASPDELVGTNNQELGVEEADLVGTDGTRVVWIAGGALHVAELDDDVRMDGRIDLSARGARQLFLRGDRVLVIGTTYGTYGPMTGVAEQGVAFDGDRTAVDAETDPTLTEPAQPEPTVPDTTVPNTTVPDTTVPVPTTTIAEPPPGELPPGELPPVEPLPIEPPPIEPPPFQVATTLTLISIEDPTAPRPLASADVEGDLVAARQIDGTTRLVVRSAPEVAMDLMVAPSRAAAIDVVESVDAGSLLPQVFEDGSVRPLGSCEDVLVTSATTATPVGGVGAGDGAAVDMVFAPTPELTTITVLTVGAELGDGLGDLAPVSLQGTADTVYASADALYVASGSWDEAGPRTDVHRFDLTGDGPASYTGSGRVPGWLLNQFSLSEHEGALRVVTTTQRTEPTPAPTPGAEEPAVLRSAPMAFDTEARLSVLDTDGTLDELGHVDGLGVGEEVQSVRFLGDLGYVVTFRQTDPLYALDLSDPSNPTVLGELKITGFSQYLHPVGDGLLLGIGREADPETGVDEGFKVSLFDISDPTTLRELDKLVLPEAWSEVAQDHKAFSWDPRRNQAIFPVGESTLVMRVDGARLSRVGELVHTGGRMRLAPNRSRIVDGTIWTVSELGLGATPADAPTTVQMVPPS